MSLEGGGGGGGKREKPPLSLMARKEQQGGEDEERKVFQKERDGKRRASTESREKGKHVHVTKFLPLLPPPNPS